MTDLEKILENIYKLFTEINLELIIALFALLLSIYNFFSNKKINRLEKRTKLLAEISIAQQNELEITQIYSEIKDLNIRRSKTTHDSIIRIYKQSKKNHNSIKEIYETFLKYPQISIHKLEEIRPRVQKLIHENKTMIIEAKEILDESKKYISNSPKIILKP